MVKAEEELEEILSRPTEADVAAMRQLAGDLLIMGAAGKMGPSLTRLARRASDEAGSKRRIFAVARFTNASVKEQFAGQGIETISADLLDRDALSKLPNAPNVIFMAARKFGTQGAEHLTWAMNTYLPGLVAEHFKNSQIVAFSTGNVYPLSPIGQGGPNESGPVAPVGEYGQSALGRERMFEYGSHTWGTPVTILRLNYAVELRYGVLVDIGRAVYQKRPLNLAMSAVNVIWQRDANSVALRSLLHCQSPPFVLNVTGPETLSVRKIAQEFGVRFKIEPQFAGAEGEHALLSNAGQCQRLFGKPTVSVEQLIDWTADWLAQGGASLNKPTHFQVRDGRF